LLGVSGCKIIVGEDPKNLTSSSLWKGAEWILKMKYSKEISNQNSSNSLQQYGKLLNQNVVTLNEYLEHGASILMLNE